MAENIFREEVWAISAGVGGRPAGRLAGDIDMASLMRRRPESSSQTKMDSLGRRQSGGEGACGFYTSAFGRK